ncbi:uncharacterized protein ISCGN_031578 [Ixodes scapularis]
MANPIMLYVQFLITLAGLTGSPTHQGDSSERQVIMSPLQLNWTSDAHFQASEEPGNIFRKLVFAKEARPTSTTCLAHETTKRPRQLFSVRGHGGTPPGAMANPIMLYVQVSRSHSLHYVAACPKVPNMICARKRHALQPLPAYFLSDLDLAQTVTLPASQEPAQPGSPLASAGAPDTDDVIASDHQYSITGCIDQALRDRIRQLEELASANEKLRKDNDRLQKENEALRKKVAHLEEMYDKAEEVIDATIPFQNFTLTAVQQDPKKLAFYTGFDSLERFLAFYKFVQAGYEAHKESQGPQRRSPYLSMDDQLLLVLSRLRVGLLEQDLAYRFRIHISTVSRVWTFWIGYLADYLAQLNYWPSRQVVNKHMPECFIEAYPSTRVILDCTEIFIETPSDFRVQSDTYSSYKCHNTAKGLLGITPNGFVSFVSDLAPGRVSDKALTACSGLCNLLEPGDSVMADRGFLITEEVEAAGANLNIPPFLGGRLQLSLEDEAKTRAIAKVRIHVERASRRYKFVIFAIDYLTKFVEAKAVRNIEASTVQKFIERRIILKHGCPTVLVTDRGTQMTARSTSDYLKFSGCVVLFSSVKRTAEVYNRPVIPSFIFLEEDGAEAGSGSISVDLEAVFRVF